MCRRLILLLGSTVALVLGPAALAAPLDTDSLDTGLADQGIRTFSMRLGRGYSPVPGLRVSPYMEVGVRSPDSGMAGMVLPTREAPNGRFLVGGLARYSLAPRWTLSFDLAAGKPFLPDQSERPRLGSHDGEDGDVVWRSGVKLGYSLGTDFSTFAVAEFGKLQIGPDPTLGRLVTAPPNSAEASLRVGFSYRF